MSDLDPADPFLWLEDVEGDAALNWVRARNAESQATLQARPEFKPIRAGLLELMDSKERIPQVTRRGEVFYNLWQDEAHPRGLWRRTTLDAYRRPAPGWETVRDLDKKRGVLAWDFTLEPQAENSLKTGYKITWPEGMQVSVVE